MKKAGRKRGFREKFSYWFDNIMSRGTISLVAILFLISFLVVVIAGILAVIFDGGVFSDIGHSIWVSLMHVIDAGTITGQSGSFSYMLLMTIVTICGLFITSVLIGIINNGMQTKMEALRKGKSRVLVQNHTIILGTSENTFTLLDELIEANSGPSEGCIVIMDDSMSKEEMEDNIRQRIPHSGNTKIICRCGNIADFSDLRVCSPEYAKSIIINSQDDFTTIKSILAVTNILKKHKNTSTFITGIISDEENYEAALIAGEDRAEVLFFDDTIARIVANTCRQPGLSSVYTELFSFKGNEIYLEKLSNTSGIKMSDINLHFPCSTVLGMERQGKIFLNPPGESIFEESDRLIILAESKGISTPVSASKYDSSLINMAPENSHSVKQKMLILGFSPRLGKILLEEDNYMAPGSEIYIAVQDEYEEELMQLPGEEYKNINVKYTFCNIYSRKVLTDLLKWKPSSVFVASSMQEDSETDDSKTLLLLLQIRAISSDMGMDHSVTSEMRSAANQALAQITEVKDFVISDNITCHMLTQISQTRELRTIFRELLSEEGAEIYMRPAEDYVKLEEELKLYTASRAASVKNQVFIGYSKAKRGSFNIVLNPGKEKTLKFHPGDRFIVLAND